MKRILLFLILFLYLFTSTGVAVNVHYCGGKVSGITFSYSNKATCPCGSKKMKKDCCKDKKHFFKLSEKHHADNVKPKIDVPFALCYFGNFVSIVQKVNPSFAFIPLPPDLPEERLNVRHCTFLI